VIEQGMWSIRTDLENLREDIWTCGRTRNVENEK
jgi:hypothetical protein